MFPSHQLVTGMVIARTAAGALGRIWEGGFVFSFSRENAFIKGKKWKWFSRGKTIVVGTLGKVHGPSEPNHASKAKGQAFSWQRPNYQVFHPEQNSPAPWEGAVLSTGGQRRVVSFTWLMASKTPTGAAVSLYPAGQCPAVPAMAKTLWEAGGLVILMLHLSWHPELIPLSPPPGYTTVNRPSTLSPGVKHADVMDAQFLWGNSIAIRGGNLHLWVIRSMGYP